MLAGHEITINAGESPYDAKCKTQILGINVQPSLADYLDPAPLPGLFPETVVPPGSGLRHSTSR